MRNCLLTTALLLLISSAPASAEIVSYTFSGRAFADPTLSSGVVLPEAAAFFASKNLDGAWFAASFSIDDAVPDSDPAAESAEYRDAVIESDFAFGPLQHESTNFCNGAFLDCSVFVDNDLPQFNLFRDQYRLRARNHAVLGVPQVLIPGTQILVDEFIVNGSFILSANAFDALSPPTLLADVAIDQDIEALFGGGTEDIILTYFGVGDAGSYSFGYRVQDVFFVPEPTGGISWGLIGLAGLCKVGRRTRRKPLV
ncbi:MAG: hypothetical protein AB8G23_22065 [Myxococcota bacterium]